MRLAVSVTSPYYETVVIDHALLVIDDNTIDPPLVVVQRDDFEGFARVPNESIVIEDRKRDGATRAKAVVALYGVVVNKRSRRSHNDKSCRATCGKKYRYRSKADIGNPRQDYGYSAVTRVGITLRY